MSSIDEEETTPLEPKELLEEIILAIVVNDHDKVKVRQVESKDRPKQLTFVVEVGDKDRGLVIGREGSMAYSIQNIMNSVGRRLGYHVQVNIDAGSGYKAKQKQKPRQNQQPEIPHGYVMVPAASVVPVPQPRRTPNHRRNFPSYRHHED